MKKLILLTAIAAATSTGVVAQVQFPVHVGEQWTTQTVWMPRSPLKQQVIFRGGMDTVQTTATYGNAAGNTAAKQWHDYIGFVKDSTAPGDLGWVIVNHEMTTKDDRVGDGGGMTTFKLRKKANKELEVVPTTLPDGRSGKFFNVDFVNTTGETGMNCGGITGKNGRIWTAEEWMQSSNPGIFAGGNGYRDTTDFVIGTTTPAGFPGLNGRTIRRFQNLNWMVEVDPKTGRAIRKQYNWGRAGWEGGVLMPDNKTVYLFEDGSPGILAKFEATNAGDFTAGQLFVYKHDVSSRWIPIENNLDTLLILNTVAIRRGATMFNRLEWGAVYNGKVYITETGRDAFNFNSGNALSGVVSPTLVSGYKTRFSIVNGVSFPNSDAAAADSVRIGRFADYYGRVIEFDPATGNVRSFLEGGPFRSSSTSSELPVYPAKHLSNPDGLDFFKFGNKTYMMIQEDLNGTSFNRMPNGLSGTICELYLLDMDIPGPSINDLQRLTACSPGAEITGAIQIDYETILVNAQHPNTSNIAPYNNSLTYAITGFDTTKAGPPVTSIIGTEVKTKNFTIYPNPVSRELHISQPMDVAIYNMSGARLKVLRNVQKVDVSDMAAGVYFIRSADGETLKFIVE